MKKDLISKDLLKTMAKDISKHILNIDIKEDMEIIDKEFVRIEKRDADLIFKNGKELIHIEIQNNNHKEMHLRMHRYYSDILFEYEDYKISQYLLYIGKYNCSMISQIKRDRIDYSYDIINFKDLDCQKFLDSDDPSAVTLAILCDFKGKDKQLVINNILQKLKELSDERDYKKYLKALSIYSLNRNLGKELKKGVDMFNFNIEESPLYQLAIERGMKQGIEKGIEKGREEAKKNTSFNNAYIMITKFGMEIDTIGKEFNLNKDELLDYINSRK